MSFKDIINKYKTYIKSSFKNFSLVIVVFDGYLMQSTKDHCHRKRQPIHDMEIIFGTQTRLSCKKVTFLSNPKNKQRFINMLADYLREEGVNVFQSQGDADVDSKNSDTAGTQL